MKRRVYASLALVLLLISFNKKILAQTASDPAYYTVLGAFAIHDNAKKFVQQLANESIASSYIFNEPSKIYYVYTDVFKDKKEAEKVVIGFRETPKFYDAWVRKIPSDPDITENNAQFRDLNPTDSEVLTKEEESIGQDAGITQYDHVTLLNTEVFLSLFEGSNNRIVQGKVKIVDPEKAKLTGEAEGNQYLMLQVPKNKTGNVSLICDIFGYRKIQQEVNFLEPLRDSSDYVELLGTTLVVHFNLIRYRRGDISTLYNVYFYNDAAIMLNESKYQLQELLSMMKENSKIQIRLHGHSNGNYFGKIITPTSNTNFFSLSQDTHEILGSANLLSLKRAEVVRDYLVHNGVSGHRIKVTAWGGKRPIFDKHSTNAKKNLRVDVEITQD